MRIKSVFTIGVSDSTLADAARRQAWQLTALPTLNDAELMLKTGASCDLTLFAIPANANAPREYVQSLRSLPAAGALVVVTESGQFSSCAGELMECGAAEVLPGPLSDVNFEALLLRWARSIDKASADSRKATFVVGQPLHEIEREMLVRTLDMTNGNRTRAAAILGISVRTLYSKLLEIEQLRKLAAAKSEPPVELANRPISSGSRHNLASV
jgi:ActR/RegA family two-component response regulator